MYDWILSSKYIEIESEIECLYVDIFVHVLCMRMWTEYNMFIALNKVQTVNFGHESLS